MSLSEAFENLQIQSDLTLFKDGQEFIDYLEKGDQQLEIVFLDLNMPKKNGLECPEYLRKHKKFKDVFVAIYSTSSSDKDMEITLLHGANIYIQKPANFESLTNVIDRTLRSCYQYATSQLDTHSFLLKL